MRVVLDTNTVVSGFLWDKQPRAIIEPAILASPVSPDPDDDHVLACALAARADIIVSGDAHLLNLKHYQGMRIVYAAEAVRSLAQ